MSRSGNNDFLYFKEYQVKPSNVHYHLPYHLIAEKIELTTRSVFLWDVGGVEWKVGQVFGFLDSPLFIDIHING